MDKWFLTEEGKKAAKKSFEKMPKEIQEQVKEATRELEEFLRNAEDTNDCGA